MAYCREVGLGRGGAEGHRPRLGHRVTAPAGVQGVEVEPGERHIPAVHPVGVLEGPGAQSRGDRLRGAQVGGVEGQPRVTVPAEFVRQDGHSFDHIVNAHDGPPGGYDAAESLTQGQWSTYSLRIFSWMGWPS